MNSYYFFSIKNSNGPSASAFAPESTKLVHELTADLNGINELNFNLTLIKLTVGRKGLLKSDDLSDIKNVWQDYQLNSLAWPLFSLRLKTVIENELTGAEGIDWIMANINGKEEQKTYYIPRFKQMLDVLNLQETMYVQGTNHIIKPVFSFEKIKKYAIFSEPSNRDYWKITSGLYISETLKKAIVKAKITGVEFNKTTVL
jgi:hypothetical protein